MAERYDVLVIGPVSLDHNIDYQGNERKEVGGAVVASALSGTFQTPLAAYAFLGADLAAGHHQPGFDFDEAVLWPGVRWLEKVCRELAG